MNKLNDEQMDRVIKEKFRQDKEISDKANSIFANFNHQTEEKTSIKEEINKANKTVVNALFYKRLNSVLSVAAVSLTVILVGGTAIYFNRDRIQNISNNSNNQNEIITYTKMYAIKNEPLNYSNEQIVKEVENHYVKAYLIGNTDVGVEFLHDYWDEINKESIKVSSETYKIDGITGNIKDIFVGTAENSVLPYIFVLMDDGTAMYVDLHGYYNYVSDLYYYAVPLEGLTDIVGFEEKTRNFSYSRTEYTYVNAIRNDGKRKEIEIGKVNSWDDASTKTFDKLNKKYIQAHNGGAIQDDNTGSFEIDGKTYMPGAIDSRYLYYKDNSENWLSSKLYRVEKSTGNKELIASGVNATIMYDTENRICFYVVEDGYEIYKLDPNIVFRHNDESIINEVTTAKKETQTGIGENTSETKTNTNDDNNEKNTVNTNSGVFENLVSKTYVVEIRDEDYGKKEYYNAKYILNFTSSDNFSIQINTYYQGKNKDITIPNVKINKTSGAAGTTYIEFSFIGYDENNYEYKGDGILSINQVETPNLNLNIHIPSNVFDYVNVSIENKKLDLANGPTTYYLKENNKEYVLSIIDKASGCISYKFQEGKSSKDNANDIIKNAYIVADGTFTFQEKDYLFRIKFISNNEIEITKEMAGEILMKEHLYKK